MNKFLLCLSLLAVGSASALAFPKAIYVKQGDNFTKYNFGVASDLVFSDNGKKLAISGYGETIDLDKIDYITFSAPVDDTSLSPAEQKQRLLDIGMEAMSKVDLNANRELVIMFDRFFNDEDSEAPAEFEVPGEYWDIHKKTRSLMKAVRELARGNASAARAAKSEVVDLYKLSDYFGVYTANPKTEKWEKTADADFLEIRFQSADSDYYKVRLQTGAEISSWSSPEANVELAKEVVITFSKGNKELASALMTSNLIQDKDIEIIFNVKTPSYNAVNSLRALNDGITDKIEVVYNGERILSASATIDGKNLLIYDEMHDAVKEATHYHDADGNCMGENPDLLISHFIRGNTSVDLLGKLQATGKVFGFNKLYDNLSQDSYVDEYFDGTGYVYTSGKVVDWNPLTRNLIRTYDIPSVYDANVRCLNNYSDISFAYDNSNKIQGYLSWECDIEEDESYYWNDEEEEPTNGYIILDDYLVYTSRDRNYEYDYEKNEEIITYGDWTYTRNTYNEEEDYWQSQEIAVNPEDVILPLSGSELYYGILPKLTFPDLTSFIFEDYFTKSAFQSMIDEYDEIIDTYYSITGHERDDDDDDYWD